MFRQETDLAALYPQDVFGEIDACLMGFKHVQTQEEIDITALWDQRMVYGICR